MNELKLARKDAPDVLIRGKLLAQVDSDEAGRDGGGMRRGRWTRLQLWELKDHDWAAVSIGCSDKPGEIDIGDVLRVKEDLDFLKRQHQVMSFFGYTWLAKKLAEQLGWTVVEVIE